MLSFFFFFCIFVSFVFASKYIYINSNQKTCILKYRSQILEHPSIYGTGEYGNVSGVPKMIVIF